MLSKIVILLISMSFILFVGCQDNSNTKQVSSSIKEDSNLTDLSETKPENSTLYEGVDQEELPAEILDFVDVYGEHYQVEINHDVDPNIYNDSSFSRNGHKIVYEDEEYTSRLGVDVSVYQGNIDWQKVKAAGYDFAILRLGYRGYGSTGSLNIDETFHNNIKGAQDAGLDVGVYFFAQAISEEEAIEEANFVIENLEGYELQLPIAYDPESILHDVARTDDVTGEQFTKNTKVFCDTIESAGYDSMIYANMLWEAYKLDLEYLSKYPIWYADYELFPQTPYNFFMWQYTNVGQVDGISGDVDINIQFIKK